MLATRKNLADQFQIFIRTRPDFMAYIKKDTDLIVPGYSVTPAIDCAEPIPLAICGIHITFRVSESLEEVDALYRWYTALCQRMAGFPGMILPYGKILTNIIVENFDGFLHEWPVSCIAPAIRESMAIVGVQHCVCALLLAGDEVLPALKSPRDIQFMLTGVNQYFVITLPDGDYELIAPGIIYAMDLIAMRATANTGALSLSNILDTFDKVILANETYRRWSTRARSAGDNKRAICYILRELNTIIDNEKF